MKKLILAIIAVFFFAAPVFALDISDYFPVAVGNTWTFASGTGVVSDVITVRSSTPNSGGTIYLFESQFAGMTTARLYSIRNNRVLILGTRDGFGRHHENRLPLPVALAPPGDVGTFMSRNDNVQFSASRASISFGGRTFNDVIVFEQVIDGGFVTRRSYFARGIGLVYETGQMGSGPTTVFRQLVDSNVSQ